MQTIEIKLSKIATAVETAGLSADQARHLIHGTGGSPRRARKAIRLGLHQQLIDAYAASLAETGAHATAVVACRRLWTDLAPAATPEDEEGAQPEPAARTPRALPRRVAAKPATNPAALRDLLAA